MMSWELVFWFGNLGLVSLVIGIIWELVRNAKPGTSPHTFWVGALCAHFVFSLGSTGLKDPLPLIGYCRRWASVKDVTSRKIILTHLEKETCCVKIWSTHFTLLPPDHNFFSFTIITLKWIKLNRSQLLGNIFSNKKEYKPTDLK